MSAPYKWTLDKMVTEGRAATVAAYLFPDEVIDSSCSCRPCDKNRAAWQARITEVREAMLEAFKFKP